MPKLLTVIINLSKSLNLEITGYYEKGQFATYTYPIENSIDNIASEFDIQDVKIVKGDLVELIDILDAHQWKEVQKVRENSDRYTTTEEIWEYLTELAIKEIEKDGGL
jgi:hypothetical protein